MRRNQVILFSVLTLVGCFSAYAADPFTDLGLGRPPGMVGNSVDYAGQISPMTGTDGPNTTPTILEQQLRGTWLLHKDDSDVWSLNAKSSLFYTSSQFVIPTAQAVPQDLWDISIGGAYAHNIDADHASTVNFNIGSASDQPLVIRDIFLQSTYTYKWPCGNQSLLFFLNESTNRTFLNFTPLPGIAYLLRRPDIGLNAVFGLPFFLINYHPEAHWNFLVSAFGPALNAEAAYLPAAKVQIYSSFNWAQQQWATENRPSYATRLTYDRKKTGMGLRMPLVFPVNLDVFGGWEFHRRFYEGTSFLGGGSRENADLNPSWFAQLKLGVYWL